MRSPGRPSRSGRPAAVGFAGLFLIGGCSSPDPGQVRFMVSAPSDPALSPLTDRRVATLELRDAQKGTELGLMARLPPRGQTGQDAAMPVDLGPLPVFDKRDLRLLALDGAGLQVLGLAVERDVTLHYGDHKDISFNMRRPLFFFGANARLISTATFDQALSPGGQIYQPLHDETLLRVVDPNAATPLLQAFDVMLDAAVPVVASAGTFDGGSVLAVTLLGNLHVIDTLKLQKTQDKGTPIPDVPMQAQAVVVSPRDESALILHYDSKPADPQKVGKLTFIPDLPALRSGGTAALMTVIIDPSAGGPPLSAAWSPDGHWDVVFGTPPLDVAAADCTTAGATKKSPLRSYDASGMLIGTSVTLDYTSAVAYMEGGTRVLAQPCTKAPTGKRVGRVLLQQLQAGVVQGETALPAPGTADLSFVSGQPGALVAVGRDDVPETDTTLAYGTARMLVQTDTSFSPTASYNLDDWQIPYRATISDTGDPFPGGVDFLLRPRDLLVYRMVVSPDRTKALVAARVTHQVKSMFIDSTTVLGSSYFCRMDWLGYTYHVQLVNLQSGAREQDYLVGVQNQSCVSQWYDDSGRAVMGHCLVSCDVPDNQGHTDLQRYQEGYVPTATSVLFGRQ